PQVLSGEVKAADADECLGLALICQQHKKLHHTAYRLFADAFAEQPTLTQDLQHQHRYNAACAAALAGCGQGKDADQTDDKARIRLRRQALDWLQADLTAWRKALEEQPAKSRPAVQKTMQHWQKDADFNGVRDAQPLAKLSPAEQEAWRSLWT